MSALIIIEDPCLQWLRESANTLEEESGYVMEDPDILEFRKLVLGGRWSEAEKEVPNLIVDDSELRRV